MPEPEVPSGYDDPELAANRHAHEHPPDSIEVYPIPDPRSPDEYVWAWRRLTADRQVIRTSPAWVDTRREALTSAHREAHRDEPFATIAVLYPDDLPGDELPETLEVEG